MLSCHAFGCRIIQRLIETGDRQELAPLRALVLGASEQLAFSPYGNYVLQVRVLSCCCSLLSL